MPRKYRVKVTVPVIYPPSKGIVPVSFDVKNVGMGEAFMKEINNNQGRYLIDHVNDDQVSGLVHGAVIAGKATMEAERYTE